MPTRRRKGDKDTNGKGDGDTKLNKKIVAPKGRSTVSPTLFALFLVLLVGIAGGIYVYHFVDVNDVIENVKARYASIQKSPSPSPSSDDTVTSTPPTPKAQSAQKEPPVEEKQDSKTSTQSSKETKDKQPSKEPPSREQNTKNSKTSQKSAEQQSSKETTKDLPTKEQQNSKQVEKETQQKAYPKAAITNAADYEIRSDLDEADSLLDKKFFKKALSEYKVILEANPKSPRAQHGKALALDEISQQEMSNKLLEESIAEYMKMLTIPDVPKDLLYKAVQRCSDRQSFRGWGHKAAKSLEQLSARYPDDFKLKNDVGVKYLMIGRNGEGKKFFEEVLKQDPNNGFAKVHIGFVIKTSEKNNEESIKYLQEGIDSNEPGTQDGRFFFHLGDAYYRVKQPDKAYKVYEKGAELGLFLSAEQRSLYNVDRLTGRPWWTKEQTKNEKQLKILQDNWKTIRDEGLAQLDPKTGGFVPEEENLRETGDWKQLTLFQQGRKNEKNCRKAPKTCALAEKFREASGCTRGQIKYSVMHPGVHVWPHCGPTNCRIRAHLGLVVPEGPRIRVGRTNETRGWTEGDFIIFDDSFEHEVWHDGESLRLVLIVDMWHPELTAKEKQTLSPI